MQFPAPVDLPASLDVFRRSGDDGIDRWDGQVLIRTTRVDTAIIPFFCTVAGTTAAPALTLTVGHATHLTAVKHAVQRMIVTAPEALACLTACDPVVARLEARYPGVRPVLQADLFTALVRAISAQQVNLPWATTTRRRLAEAFGDRHTLGTHAVFSLDPMRLAGAEVAALRALQFTTRKAEYIIALATAVATGALDLEALRHASDEAVMARLTACRGLGRWTADWFLARALGRPRVVAGDLAVRKAVGAAYCDGRLPTEAEVRACTAHWGDAAGVAQQLLLHGLSQG